MRVRIAALAVTLMMVCQGQVAWGYCLQQFSNVEGFSTWKGEVPYYVSDNVKDGGRIAAIDAAFATWGAAPCSTLRFRKAGTFALSSVPFKGHDFGVYVFWHDSAATYPTEAKFVTYALVSVEADVDGAGAITAGSIAINGFSVDWATDGNQNAFDVQGEMTERVGQIIGLETSNAVNTVMRRYFKLGDTDKRTLKEDDLNAIAFLYGDGTCAGQPPAPDPATGCAAPPLSDGTPDPGVPPPADPNPTDPGATTPTPINLNKDGSGRRCTTGTQCNPGEVCSFDGVCVATTPGDGAGGGCVAGGRLGGRSGLVPLLALVVGAGLTTRRRRRRR